MNATGKELKKSRTEAKHTWTRGRERTAVIPILHPVTGAFFFNFLQQLSPIYWKLAWETPPEGNPKIVIQTQENQGWMNSWTTFFWLPARERTAIREILETNVSWKLLLSLDKSIYPLVRWRDGWQRKVSLFKELLFITNADRISPLSVWWKVKRQRGLTSAPAFRNVGIAQWVT